jgi:uncharacterized spore protein YtfJ
MPAHPSTDAAGLLDRLASSIGDRVGAGAVFGPAVAGDGVTVIPVARARFGFGGGGGPSPGGRGDGAGGGGGGSSRPVGFIELRGDRARFRRINDPVAIATGALLLVLAAAILVRTLRRCGCGHCGRRDQPVVEPDGPTPAS